MIGGFILGKIRTFLEDALRIKVVPKEPDLYGLGITSDKDDLASKQIRSAEGGSLVDVEAISKFKTLSSDRQERYNQFEALLNDATIAAAVEMYADDSTQYDYRTGKIIWAESDDQDIKTACDRLIDVLGINEKAWTHIYALCTYGDVYLRLYRKGDTSDYEELFNKDSHATTIRVKPKDGSRPIEEYIEYVDDPAVMYDLQVRDKTSGFIKMMNTEDNEPSGLFSSIVSKTLDLSDVNIYDRTSFVHICLAGNISRHPELIALRDSKTGAVNVYKVKTGKSILADAYEASQTVKLLEDSLMLDRVTKSALVRVLMIETGDMPKSEVEALLRRTKNIIEQKIALNTQNGMVSSYNSPGPVENILYFPTHKGVGGITSLNLGGDVNIKDIVDIDYFNDKKLSALKIPKQFLNYNSPEGIGNGTSLTKLSSRYAHTIMRIQNAYISGITTLLNLYFLDKGLDYINKFTLKMVSPATIEDTERDEQLNNRLDQAQTILDMIDGKTDQFGIYEVVKWMLNNFLNLSDISDILDKHSVMSDESNGFENHTDPDFGDGPELGGGPGLGGDFGTESDFGGSSDFDNEPDIGGPESEPTMSPEQ